MDAVTLSAAQADTRKKYPAMAALRDTATPGVTRGAPRLGMAQSLLSHP